MAREKSIRALHEARMHKDNIFLTLTYDDAHLKSPTLNYLDFQLFMKSLLELRTRNVTDKETRDKLYIPFMVTGEYGEKNKRPHWHALLFNYSPPDANPTHQTKLGHQVYHSKILSDLWGKGKIEFGDVTLESASYTARYAAKKLVHGADDEHNYHPIHKTSSKHAIGKKWIEKYWERTFSQGNIILPNGSPTKIPRYYVDWLKKNKPETYFTYVTQTRLKLQEASQLRARKEELEYLSELLNQKPGHPRPITLAKVRITILNQKFKRLQETLKL